MPSSRERSHATAGDAGSAVPRRDRRWSLVIVLAGRALLVGALSVWPYVKYIDPEERAAARHLNRVTVTGFHYRGGDDAGFDAVSRVWMKNGAPEDIASAVEYDGRPLRRDRPGRESLSRSRFEDELGWLSLPNGRTPCGLTAYRVHHFLGSGLADLTAAELRAVERGSATVVRVVVTCGGG